MNRRGFIRSALAATLGVAAGAVLPKLPTDTTVKVMSSVPNAGTGVFTFHNITWIEDDDCPEDIMYLLPKGLADAIYKGNAHAMKL